MTKILLGLQHHLNPLHIYCRLVKHGCCKNKSLNVCKYYEIMLYRFINVLLVFFIKIYKDKKGGLNG